MNLAHVEELFQATPDQKCAVARGGMVAAAFPEAVQAGADILNRGGNAVDAACATTLALAACEPAACGLGGQSIALVHVDGRTVVVDGSSHAPSLAHRRAIADPQELSLGYRASTVPSTVALLGYLSRRYGHLPWAALVAPAIAIAENGYRITPFQHRLQLGQLDRFLACLLYTSPSPRDRQKSRMPSSA
jgi:gamma-glutamyltranspeptidase/glutathione hydrolase